MLRSLRARVHLALNLEPRDDLAGFWAVISAFLVAVAVLVYVGNQDHPLALVVALVFANAAILSLFRPAARKKRTWRRAGVELVATSAHVFAGGLLLRYIASLGLDWDLIEYLVSGALALYLVWQVAYRFFWRPRAFEERRADETLGWYREEFPRL